MALLLADSGSTKTDWALIDPTHSYQAFQSAGINPFYQSKEEIVPVLMEQVLSHVNVDEIEKIFFYGAGCADENTSRPVYEALVHCIPKANVIEVASDMLGAARALCGREAGFACILGTGSNNAFFDGNQIVRSVGSLGFWLGDEGSGAYLGKTLIQKFLHQELPEHLQAAFAAEHPEIERLYVLEQAYRKPYPNRYFASFSTFIGKHISDSYMQQLVGDAFSLFLDKYVLKHENAERYPVHFTGSVAYYYADILAKTLARKNLTLGHILKSPLEGLVQYYS